MRPAPMSLLLVAALSCSPVIPSPVDQPPWLGIAKTAQVSVYADSAMLLETSPQAALTLRVIYAKEQHMPTITEPYVESRFHVVVDCQGERARELSVDLVAASGAKVASLPLGAEQSDWQAFDTHALQMYFVAACIRMKRARGRLEPS
jgi:hypothetical protein